MTLTCMDTGFTLEYRTGSKPWKPLPMIPHPCARNIQRWTAMPPGGTAQGSFFLADLAPGFDMTPLRPAGRYTLRFTFHAEACRASSDASTCVSWPAGQPQAAAEAVTVAVP